MYLVQVGRTGYGTWRFILHASRVELPKNVRQALELLLSTGGKDVGVSASLGAKSLNQHHCHLT